MDFTLQGKKKYRGGASVADLVGNRFLLEVSRMFWKEGRGLVKRRRNASAREIFSADKGRNASAGREGLRRVCERTRRLEARSLDLARWTVLAGSLWALWIEGTLRGSVVVAESLKIVCESPLWVGSRRTRARGSTTRSHFSFLYFLLGFCMCVVAPCPVK